MELPGVGVLVLDSGFDWYYSEVVVAGALRGRSGRVVVPGEAFEEGELGRVGEVVGAFLGGDDRALREAGPAVFEYYLDMVRIVREQEWELPLPEIGGPDEVWEYVQFGDEFQVEQQAGQVYVSIECECAWEPEHGLQLVFHDGRRITKVGPYDGHLTNLPGRDTVYASPFTR